MRLKLHKTALVATQYRFRIISWAVMAVKCPCAVRITAVYDVN